MKKKRLANYYKKTNALLYEQRRKDKKGWKEEQKIVCQFLEYIAKDNQGKQVNVLDIPVGTGRFFELYKELGFSIIGMDISEDMLKESNEKKKKVNLNISLQKGDIFNINISDRSVGLVISIRIFNLMNFDDFKKAFNEIARVTNKYIICNISTHCSFFNMSFIKFIKVISRRFLSYSFNIIKNRKTVVHSYSNVLSLFTENNLEIINKKEVITKDKSYNSFIYFLRLKDDK